MAAKDTLGRRGEEIAADYLRGAGLVIVERNWRCTLGEIDIVALDAADTVFVEVKTRAGLGYGHPLESIGEGRRTEFQLTDAGRAYTTENAEQLERLWNTTEQDASAEAGLHESVQKFMGVVHQFRFAATDEQRAKAVEVIDNARRSLYGILAD